jgi:hypothetical protein
MNRYKGKYFTLKLQDRNVENNWGVHIGRMDDTSLKKQSLSSSQETSVPIYR